MAVIANSSLTTTAKPNATGFAVSGSTFQVDIDAGDAWLETMRATGDTVWKPIGKDGLGPQLLRGPCSYPIVNGESGRLYRIHPANSTQVTASASE